MDKGGVLDIIFGRWRSQIAHAGVKLGMFEAVGREPKDAARVAEELKLDPALSYRLLRAIAAIGLLNEGPGRKFSLTPGGEYLRADHPESLRGMMLLEEGREHYAIWKHLPDMVRDGRQNAFLREFGCMAFEYASRAGSEYARIFDEAMSSFSSAETDWVLEAIAGHDFSKVAHACDVGGGHGHLLSGVLVKYPHLTGSVVDRPEVVGDETTWWSKKKNVADRCRYVAGDMFAEVPAADAYFMKHILHDWNDEECVRILSNQRRVAKPGAKVFVAEYIVPGPDTPHFAKLFDIHMMCWGTGRERTSDEYAKLIEDSGWKYLGTSYSQAGNMGVVAGGV